MLGDEMKAFRARHGITVKRAGEAMDLTGESYRLKELGRVPVTGIELAKLAEAYGEALGSAFPSYEPTDGEAVLARHLSGAA